MTDENITNEFADGEYSQENFKVENEILLKNKLLSVFSSTITADNIDEIDLLNDDWSLSNVEPGISLPENESEMSIINRKTNAFLYLKSVKRLLEQEFGVPIDFSKEANQHLTIQRTRLNISRSKNGANPTLVQSQYSHVKQDYSEKTDKDETTTITEKIFGKKKEK